MHYVKYFSINGVDTKQAACIELHGRPNAATEGAVGVLGIDVDSPSHEIYKCVAVNGNIYTWEVFESGSGGGSGGTVSNRTVWSSTETYEYGRYYYSLSALNAQDGKTPQTDDYVIDAVGNLLRINYLPEGGLTYSTELIYENDADTSVFGATIWETDADLTGAGHANSPKWNIDILTPIEGKIPQANDYILDGVGNLVRIDVVDSYAGLIDVADDVNLGGRLTTIETRLDTVEEALESGGGTTEIENKPFLGKKIVAIGDSIVAGQGDGAGGFLTALKNKYPSITIENMGVGSTTFAYNNNVPMNKSSGCIYTRIDGIPADADYIILEGGLNDFFHKDTYGVQFGSYVENLHKYPISAKYANGSYSGLYYGAEYGGTSSQVFYQDTFCGAFEMSLIKIITRFHDKKCALLIPHNPTGSKELEKYLDAEARICKKYNFPCIDLRMSSVMPRIYAVAGGSDGNSAYTVDAVHPNMAGYESQYLPAIERWLTDGSFESSVGACTKAEVEEIVSDMGGAVSSVNGKTGNVIITAADISAVPESKKITITVNDASGTPRTYELYGVEVTGGGDSGGDTGGGNDGGGTNEPVNLVPTSIDSDGSIFNENKGYQDGKRLSTSKGTLSDQTNATTTGFIKAVGGNTFELSGLTWWNTTNGYNVIAAYDEGFNFIGCVTAQNGGTTNVKTIHSSLTGDANMTTVKLIEGLGIAYIRVSFAASSAITGANAIIRKV